MRNSSPDDILHLSGHPSHAQDLTGERRSMTAIALWRARIERLGFREKLELIPSVAAVALAAILLLNVATGLLTDLRQHAIANAYYPAVRASRDLQTELRSVQRALQDAVTSEDSSGLLVADSLPNV